MDIIRTSDKALHLRLFIKSAKYSLVGVSTFLLDLAVVSALLYALHTPQEVAIALGFLIGVTINYLICRNWVFKGTLRGKLPGYVFFLIIATCGAAIIVASVNLLVDNFEVQLLVARTLVALCIGVVNFLINTFFNFKII